MDSSQHNLDEKYLTHQVFERLQIYTKFYGDLSFNVMGWVNPGVDTMLNLDTYMFSSVQGTLDSVHAVLKMGRIGDAYALLRKYYDSTIINVYTNLLILSTFDSSDPSTYTNTELTDWVKNKQTIPDYRTMFNYIQGSKQLGQLTKLIRKSGEYTNIRERCNAHTHYNFYRHVLLNDNEIYQDRLTSINDFVNDLDAIFIQHFIYIFYLKDNYMMASDYIDHLDVGMQPPEDSQYWVAPYIQTAFDKFIKPKRPDLAKVLLSNTSMELE